MSDTFKHLVSCLGTTEDVNIDSMVLISAIVRGALAELEAMIVSLSSRSKQLATSGCCLVCCLVTDTHIVTANIGDCRAVLVYRNGDNVSFSPLSIDHSVKTNEAERARISESMAAVDKIPVRPGYSQLLSAVSRFFPERADLLTLSYREYTKMLKEAASDDTNKGKDPIVLVAETFDLPVELCRMCVLRVQGVYMMTRSLGDASFKDVDC